jgi:3',5'-nucleoside bisphosphate phosphatase
MKYVDLHMHTKYSDGTSEPAELVKAARLLGLDSIAITDHDIMAGYPEALEEAKRWKMHLIPGVEISTKKYHILGLNVNPIAPILHDLLKEIREIQRRLCAGRIKNLQNLGIPITMEKLDLAFPESRLGRYNIYMAMLQDTDCIDYFAKNEPNLANEGIFQKYLGKGGLAKRVDGIEDAQPERVIEAIRIAGGTAIIAHPFKDVEDMAELDLLRTYGLAGLEIQPGFGNKNVPFREYALRHGLKISYGSDYHGPAFDRKILRREENKIDLEDLFSVRESNLLKT